MPPTQTARRVHCDWRHSGQDVVCSWRVYVFVCWRRCVVVAPHHFREAKQRMTIMMLTLCRISTDRVRHVVASPPLTVGLVGQRHLLPVERRTAAGATRPAELATELRYTRNSKHA